MSQSFVSGLFCGEIFIAKYLPDQINKEPFIRVGKEQNFEIGEAQFETKTIKGYNCDNFGQEIDRDDTYISRSISLSGKAHQKPLLALHLLGEVVLRDAQIAGNNLLTPATISIAQGKYADLPKVNYDTNNPPIVSKIGTAITGITLPSGTPVSILSVGHGLVTGDQVIFYNVGGTVELNGEIYTITKTDNDNFTLNGTDGDDFTAWTSGGTSNKVYTELTDYEINYKNGMIFITENSTITGSSVLFAGTWLGKDAITTVESNTEASISAHVRFVGKNRKDNTDVTIDCYKVSLRPSGALQILQDNYVSYGFTGNILPDADGKTIIFS